MGKVQLAEIRKETNGTTSNNAYPRFSCNCSFLAVNSFYIIPGNSLETLPSNCDFASDPADATGDPVNNSDPSGMCGKSGTGNGWDLINPFRSNNPIYCWSQKNSNKITDGIKNYLNPNPFKSQFNQNWDNRGFGYAVNQYNPVYGILIHTYNAYKLSQSPCSSNWAIAEQSDIALVNLISLGLIALPTASAMSDALSSAGSGAEEVVPFATITGPDGIELPGIPNRAIGVPTETGNGLNYEIPPGTPGLNSRVVSIRVMDPVTSGPYQYPGGYISYMNESGQTVNPLSGQTIARSDPFAHIPLPPR